MHRAALSILLLAAIELRADPNECSAEATSQIEHDFKQAAKNHDRDRILELANELVQRYELAGRWKNMRELVKRVESIRGAAGWGTPLGGLRAHRSVFGDYPDQKIRAHGPVRISYAYVDRKLTVPLTINGAPANYMLDTGAPTNSMSAAEAKRLGLKVHESQQLAVGYVFNELKPGGIAIADDLTIGNFHMRNVLFEVAPEGMPGILGLPTLVAMQTVRWNSDGSLEFGFPAARDRAKPNVCLFGNSPMVRAEIQGREAIFALDTGSDLTLLFPRFSRDFAELAQSASPGNEVVLGEKFKDPAAKIMDKLRLRVGGVQMGTGLALLLTKDTSGPTPAHGLLGMDTMEQSQAVTLDFAAMRMSLEGSDAAPAPTTSEATCPLPPSFVCAEGSRCTMQTDSDNQICLLERVPRSAWPGNPVIDTLIEDGKRCDVGENVRCPAGKSCRAVFTSNQSCSIVIQDR